MHAETPRPTPDDRSDTVSVGVGGTVTPRLSSARGEERRTSGPADDSVDATCVSLLSLATAFLTVSLLGFGGGIIWARRIAVERRGWINDAEFVDIVSLTQFMPGPNILGIAVCVGAQLRGVAGAVSAVCGFLLLPWSLGMGFGVLCLAYAHTPTLRSVLGGVSAAAAGLLIATGVRLLLSQRRRPMAVTISGLAVVLMAFTKLPLLAVLLGLAPISIAVAAFREQFAS